MTENGGENGEEWEEESRPGGDVAREQVVNMDSSLQSESGGNESGTKWKNQKCWITDRIIQKKKNMVQGSKLSGLLYTIYTNKFRNCKN